MALVAGQLLGLASLAAALVSPDGTGRLPAMGWNSWNEYECNISEDVFTTVARQLVDLGLKDLGYEYVNIDDCWSDKELRRNATTNELIPDANKFPRGIVKTAEVVHSLGLKLGIYGDAGTDTCGGYAGSLGYEELDAATFSKWGIDYLKYDNCNVPSEWVDEYEYIPEEPESGRAPPGYDWGTSNTAKRYRTMGDALQKQNRTIQYSLCVWGHARVQEWGNSTGHSWRMWGDIFPAWKGKEKWSWGLMPIVNQASLTWEWTDFGAHNDWDMLEVGNGDLTLEENRSHFALWCALKSPLIIGTPLDTLGLRKPILDILSNRELIDFNQDPVYGASAMPYKWGNDRPAGTSDMEHPAAFWVGTSVKGIHVFLLNTQDVAVQMRAVFAEIPPLNATASEELLVHDMWTGEDIGTFKEYFELEVKTHDTAALRITTVDGKHPNPNWSPK
ncbi:family 27 putative glycoside hydrolase [Triangularia verruculosa]|uniref:Alpha-galactosidase n=1 Tax=Triangularia verruculosa TaxID=2587418 RepID=A0AAN7AT93_9PEZI|nr:family 27 putative glycoside hydrolase [Triangularia verruculosa]